MTELVLAVVASWLRIALPREVSMPTIQLPHNLTTWAAFGVAAITAAYQAFVTHDLAAASQSLAAALAILGIGGTASATHADTQSMRANATVAAKPAARQWP